jgi:hypothetical protein
VHWYDGVCEEEMLVLVGDPAITEFGSLTKVVASEKVEHEELERRDRWLPMLDMVEDWC